MLEDGVNIVQISEFLGHSDLDTTKRGGKKIKTFNIIRIARYAKIAMHFYFCSDFSKVLISGINHYPFEWRGSCL